MSDVVHDTAQNVQGQPLPSGATPAPEQQPTASSRGTPGVFWGTGRRKSAVARVRLVRGEGKIVVNDRDLNTYFTEPQELAAIREPLMLVNAASHWNAFINVRGGGHSGQAGAVRLGMARALLRADQRYEAPLRDANLLTRDSRVVERKKYGRRKARRRFQFSKR